jgi:hypothetical protein
MAEFDNRVGHSNGDKYKAAHPESDIVNEFGSAPI